jgi:hypothetical protein
LLDVSANPNFGISNFATDLFISEYVETNSGSSKYIEIFNGTGATVDLSDYRFVLYANGGQAATADVQLSGNLAHNSTIVLKNSTSTLYGGAAVDNAAVNFNGDDAVALYRISTNSNVDIIGSIGSDPGTQWQSGSHSTLDKTLVRKSSVTGGITVNPASGFSTLTSEWDVYNVNTVSYLGSHVYNDFLSDNVSGYSALNVGNSTSQEVTGLSSFTTYYYRVRAVSANCTTGNSNVIAATTEGAVTWTLVNGEAKWMPEFYSDGITPVVIDPTTRVIIMTNYNTGTDGLFTPESLTLNAGTFIVTEGTTLTVQNQIINNGAAANFIVENGASLIQVNDVDNTGDFTVQKDSNPLYKLDYTVWSSPVTGQVLQDFSPLTLPNRFYTYGIDTDNEEAYISTSSAGTFQPGIGYLIRMPDHLPAEHPDYNGYELGASGAEGALPYTLEGEYAGNLINGDVPVALSTQDQFYSMVGNPYASPISVEEFFTENAGVLHGDAGIYFWRKRNSQAATSYAALTTTSYAANDGGVESGDDPGTYSNGGQQWEDYYENTSPSEWVIAPGQGFFVRGNGAAGNLMFTNGMRRNAGTGQPFFRMNQPQLSRLWLNLYSETNFSQTSIAYAEGATLGVDYGKDARRFASPNLSLYSVVGEDSFTIQSRPAFEDTDVVPMGYNVNTAGTYTIALHRKDGVFEDGQNVYLKDTQLDIIHDFSGGIYTFATEAGTFNERFRVIYSDGALGVNNPVANNNTVVVYNKENVLNVNSGNIQITAITVYDLRGRVLYTATDINSAEAVINMQPQQQVLLVEVNTATGKVTKKVVY